MKHVNDSLESHMLIHTGDKPHEYGICGESLTIKASLKKHRLIYTEEKSNKCGVCGNSFTCKHHLKKHMLIYTGDIHITVKLVENHLYRNAILHSICLFISG